MCITKIIRKYELSKYVAHIFEWMFIDVSYFSRTINDSLCNKSDMMFLI